MIIGVLNNPSAQVNRRDPTLAGRLADQLGEHGILVSPPTREATEDALRGLVARGADPIAIHGGDGTAHTALTALHQVCGDTLPRIALLRGGTMNTTAQGLGIRGRPLSLIQWMLDQARAGEPLPTKRRWLLLADVDTPEGPKTLAGFMWGAGIWARYIELYDEGSLPPGPLKAALVLGRGILSTPFRGAYIQRMTQRVEARVTVDGEAWPNTDFAVLAAGTTDEVGLGFRPFYEVLDHPRMLQAVGMGSSIPRVARELWQVWWGRPFQHPDNHNVLAHTLDIEATEPIVFSFDGDLHRVGPHVRLRVGPPVDMVVPPRS